MVLVTAKMAAVWLFIFIIGVSYAFTVPVQPKYNRRKRERKKKLNTNKKNSQGVFTENVSTEENRRGFSAGVGEKNYQTREGTEKSGIY